jgi:diguanylate cyclase (GGDEF)-like protein
LLLLLAGIGLASPARATGPAFDALFQRLERGEIWTLDAARTDRRLAELAALVPAGDGHRALLHQALRCDWHWRNDVRAQLADAEDGLRRALQARDTEARIRFHYCRAAAREQMDTTPAVLADYAAGIELARSSENHRLLADGLAARGGMHSLLGEQSSAVLDFLAAQRLYERAGAHPDAEANLLNLAVAYRRMGDTAKAGEYLRQSEQYAERSGDWSALTSTLMQQGYLAEDAGQPDEALARYQRVLEIARRQTSVYDMGSAHLGMALPYILQREYGRALAVLEQAEREFATVGDSSNQDMIELRRGQAYAGLGRHAEALDAYARAAATIERSGNLRYQAMLYEARAASEEARGQPAAAVADLRRYIAAHEALEARNHDQQAETLRFRFDAERSELENRRLGAEQALRDRQLAALLKARHWQRIAIALGGVLLLLLGALVMRQFARMRRLRELASTDPLTGVANRRSIELHGEAMLLHARVHGHPLCALLLDLDHFKRINDANGHLAGDEVLARVARTCQAALRQGDRLGRIGGEEFLILLPNTRMAQALPIAERLCDALRELDYSDIPASAVVTASIGAAELQAQDTDLKELVRRADLALYRAKHRGRDRVEVADPAAPVPDPARARAAGEATATSQRG